MKFSTVFAVAAAAMVGSVAAQDCTVAQQASAFTSLASLLSGTDLEGCASKSGYNMLQATGLPTDEQKTKMCGTPDCQSLIKTVISKNPPNCVLTIPTSGAKMNVYSLANTFADDCKRLVTPAPAASTPAPATSKPSTPSTGGTPATSTPATATPSTGGSTPAPTKVAC